MFESVDRVVTAVLGGGQGARLWPLTKHRAKPAVPLAGKFRLIDIPISNSLHAGIEKIFVLTQFNSSSLHRHIAQTYRFDSFRSGFVHILAAEQSLDHRDWYQGTADAVRQNLRRLIHGDPSEVLILSGDQLYKMDLRRLVLQHREQKADLTIAVSAVPPQRAHGFGVMSLDGEGRIVDFAEKPQDPEALEGFVVGGESLGMLGFPATERACLASMGIYVFRLEVLREVLEGTSSVDFGREVVPDAIHRYRVMAFGYPGYWRDIGTIPSFHEASLELTLEEPPLDLFSQQDPIYTHARFLPGTRIDGCDIRQSIVCDGSMISGSSIDHSVIGIRTRVGERSVIERSVIMGANRYEWDPPREVGAGVGRDCVVRNAILDLDVGVGDGCRLTNERGVEEAEEDSWVIRGGIIVVARGAQILPGTVI